MNLSRTNGSIDFYDGPWDKIRQITKFVLNFQSQRTGLCVNGLENNFLCRKIINCQFLETYCCKQVEKKQALKHLEFHKKFIVCKVWKIYNIKVQVS